MKALIITSSPNAPLLQKILFQVLEFTEDQILWADPDKGGFSLRVKPDVIIPVGADALDKIEEGLSIVKVAGSVLDYNGVPVVPVFAPGYIDKNPHLFRRWAEDFYRAYQVMCGIEELAKDNQTVIVDDVTILWELVDNIKRAGIVAFDYESTSLTDLKHHDPDFKLTLLTLSFQQGSSYVIPLFHEESPLTPEFINTIRDVLEKEVFLNPDVIKVGQNVKFDLHCNVWWGIAEVRGPVHDTMVMHHLLDEHASHKLKEMVRRYNPRYSDYEAALGTFKNWADIPLDTLIKYGGLDSDLTLRLYWQFTEMLLNEDERLYILFRNLYAPATTALFVMERDGMLVNKEFLLESIESVKGMIKDVEQDMRGNVTVMKFQQHRMEKGLEDYITGLEEKMLVLENKKFKSDQATRNNAAKITTLSETLDQYYNGDLDPKDWLKPAQYVLNFASSQQMVELFYGRNGFCFEVPSDQYGRPQRSTGKDVLDMLNDKSGFVDNLLAYRQLKKVLSTYLEGILVRLDSKHRIHGTFNQTGTKTGRLSSSDPNLQNIIKRTKYKKVEDAVAMVMKCFSVPFGGYLMQSDYSQAELRMIAHYSEEQAMLEAYNNGEDLHALTAATTMGLSLAKFKQLPPKEFKMNRYEAKSTNFGFCLSGDTKVITHRGNIPITDICEGDQVLTHKGNWRRVNDTQCIPFSKLYHIKTRTGKEIKCTPDHMMFVMFPSANGNPTRYGWVRAEDLETGMYLVNNPYDGHHGQSNMGRDLSLVIGWFLAEGGAQGNSGRISQIEDKNPDVFKRMNVVLPGTYSYRFAKYDKSQEFFALSSDIMTSVIGKYIDYSLKASDKNFSSLIPTLSKDDKRYILAGLYDGDGCIRMQGNSQLSIQYSSISKQLVTDMQVCLESLGISSTIYTYDAYMYSLNISGSRSRRLFLETIPTVKVNRVSYNPKRNFSAEEAIKYIGIIDHDDYVYDLTVQEDHSFVANGLVTHNCYGMSAEGFKEYARTNYGIEVTLKQAKERRAKFFKKYPKLLDYHKIYIAKAKKFGYVRTLFGQKLRLPDIYSKDKQKQSHAERNAINGPIQGSAGQMMVLAIALMQHRAPGLMSCNTVHDSLMNYIVSPEAAIPIIKETMENLPMMDYFEREVDSVSMAVDFEASQASWGELKELN